MTETYTIQITTEHRLGTDVEVRAGLTEERLEQVIDSARFRAPRGATQTFKVTEDDIEEPIHLLKGGRRDTLACGEASGRYTRIASKVTCQACTQDKPPAVAIRAAYRVLAPQGRGWVKLTAIARHAGLTAGQLQAGVQELQDADPDVEVMPESNQKTLTEDDRRNAVRVGGDWNHLIAWI
jgi:hypothetical protein